ncbi:bifunctional homocysteine S-methyltransferase/methylenetetrahydrofolate reductase [Vallitalea pronyensis]|uniref:Bifunctional homocysteine S-methyltransferase/methylenetetrahydrofolate reductase n=1 Tax=Vallitalea pronyensis TaxID=1348613 RepID=A0A8J8MM04_9FIRM|nr:bifunctional homocysteine S-methyltransferase/methylenetetrahydrofolate reductase [Vallitalea pronyensis]QUI23994.1 bifunctional homocysteine S-methyltransferase/methylenetetrahydrofolate reductase [Vallitalea pronyensis]
MHIKEYLKHNILVVDGAMGTYYAMKTAEDTTLAEKANLHNPHIIEEIHQEYIAAGAKLIRTNTFSANTVSLNCDEAMVRAVLREGYRIAEQCATGHGIFVGASIGPIPEKERDMDALVVEYKMIIDTLLELGNELFMFETFSSIKYIKILADYIMGKNKEAEIMAQFSVNAFGYSKEGISARRLIKDARQVPGLVAYGFNCGIGVGHLYKVIKSLALEDENIIAIPNAGYPDKIFERTVYRDNAKYFAESMMDIRQLGIKILGGCCGTTPKHIVSFINQLHEDYRPVSIKKHKHIVEIKKKTKKNNAFFNKLSKGEFVVAVELDPPFNSQVNRIMEGAHQLKAEDIDIITIADSPLSRPRADSVIIASRIHRETGIDVMPHICCRDKNVIGLKSTLLGAHIENIRNVLLVTGDPIPSEERSETTSVFNLHSIKLMALVNELNEALGAEDPFVYGGALNLNVKDVQRIIPRIKKKQASGARYLLTQPIYDEKALDNLRIIKEQVDIKILGGILPLVSYKNARFLNNEIAGIEIPECICSKFTKDMSREEAQDVGIEIAMAMARKIKAVADGLYMMTPFNRFEMVSRIIEGVK